MYILLPPVVLLGLLSPLTGAQFTGITTQAVVGGLDPNASVLGNYYNQ
jgi:hypothetical protein